MAMPEFAYWQSESNGRWYFNLKAPNYEVVCPSQGYETRQGCLKGIRAVRLYAPIARRRLVYKDSSPS